ncbi:Uma2 family endonuclease [Myxococcaceae bacterium GXIMD 01537]
MGGGRFMEQSDKSPWDELGLISLEDGWPEEALAEDGPPATVGAAGGHQRVAAVLMAELKRRFDADLGKLGGWWIHYRPQVHLGAEVLVPDLAGWRQSRLPESPGPARQVEALAPDWVCEVLLPTTASIDRGRKMSGYQRVGVPCLWLIDPVGHTLEVYLRDRTGWELLSCFSEDAVVRADPFDEVALELGPLWLSPPRALP